MSSDAEFVEQLKKIVLCNHKFTANIYQELQNDTNVFYSPISIQIALLLAYTGASGETAKEMESGLHLLQKKAETLKLVEILLKKLKNPKLTVKNEIFIQQSYKIKDEYKANTEKYFQSNSESVDFKKNAEKARQIINTWVSDNTKQKIIDLIPAGILDEYTRLVLVNAVHFKDNWKVIFDAKNTTDERFYNTETDFFNVRMMHLSENFKYLEKKFFKVLELPYKDKNFRMIIFLPKEINGINKLEAELQNINLTDILDQMFRAKVNLSFPKFKMENFTNFKTILKRLGMTTMFSDEADFSEMYDSSEFPLYISDVLHKAVVEVGEEGSKAAVAAAARLVLRCENFMKIYDFVVNHPFIFYILHNDLIIFVGKKSTGF